MVYDIKILQGIAELTRDWEFRKDALFGFMCERGGECWADSRYQHRMYPEYFKPETPVTIRLYSLDADNQKLVLQYIANVLMDGITSLVVDI